MNVDYPHDGVLFSKENLYSVREAVTEVVFSILTNRIPKIEHHDQNQLRDNRVYFILPLLSFLALCRLTIMVICGGILVSSSLLCGPRRTRLGLPYHPAP